MENPYTILPEKAFWRTAVADKNMLEIDELWNPKYPISEESRIATFGSCFAQHFGEALRARRFNWMNGEPAMTGLSNENIRHFNYNQFSCRTANIYTTSLLKQWLGWALLQNTQPTEYWEVDGRCFDPFRPRIEPNGFESVEEMRRSRQVTVDALAEVVRRADVFVFTLGLTESWVSAVDGYEYPMCPGTAAGEYDENKHKFVAQGYETIIGNLRQSVDMLRNANPEIKILLTVSPVPLTATNTGNHVLVATSASKAILRAVTDAMVSEFDYIDYFPSYEIISSPVYKGVFFKKNLRQVEKRGVDHVMQNFFLGLGLGEVKPVEKTAPNKEDIVAEKIADIACEEEILGAFAGADKKQ